MKILHTSDWHLGRPLYGRRRYPEFECFLDWLVDTIEQQAIDALLVAGDVFDSASPSNRAQELYYRFLRRVTTSCCRHVVIIGGNHDSPSFLEAPKTLLRALNVHVVGAATDNPADQVIELTDATGAPQLLVCAVPYLRDRDIRLVEAGESVEDKERKLLQGIRIRYAAVVAEAEQIREKQTRPTPLVGMGHLFTAGGRTVEGDGVRALYVGSLAHVPAGIFPPALDYVALGHLHVPQPVGEAETIRYSGSPLAMGFGEAGQNKSVCMVEFESPEARITLLPVPVFQQLECVRGDWETIAARLRELAGPGTPMWLEVIYEGQELVADLRERVEQLVADSALEILRVKNARLTERLLGGFDARTTLDDLDPTDVFRRCLTQHEVPAEQLPALLQAYGEILSSVQEEDPGAR